jgi:hypothetical protein
LDGASGEQAAGLDGRSIHFYKFHYQSWGAAAVIASVMWFKSTSGRHDRVSAPYRGNATPLLQAFVGRVEASKLSVSE